MNHVEFRSKIDTSAGKVFAWHAHPGAFQRLTPPWLPIELKRFEGIREGDCAEIRIGAGPAMVTWIAEHHDIIEGRQFCDRQVKGPFAHWDHTHRFDPDGPDTSTLIDQIEYELPLGGLGDWLGNGLTRYELKRQFAYRHRITQNDLALHRRYNPEGHSLKIAVSGTSGLIGSPLCAFLTTGGHDVLHLVHSPPTVDDEIYWNHETGDIEADKLEGLDAVIHLAGENVFALRWTDDKKRRIRASRVQGTRLISQTLAALENPPDVFLSASGVSYYGDHGTEVITEASEPQHTGFLSTVCEAWEAATQPAADAGIRAVQLRTGAVLTPAGGALQLMLPAFRLGLGGRVGPENQYVPWIALDDAIGGYYHALMTNTVEGPVNLTAPTPVTMNTYAKTLAGVLNRPALLNIPGGLARIFADEVADEMLLQSLRVIPQKLNDTGYSFLFPHLGVALRHLLGKTMVPIATT